MILKGSQRSGGNQLAAHLLRTDENEHVEVHEVRGFVADDVRGAMQEAYATSKGTRAKQYIFSLSLNPPERESVPVPVFEDAIERAEQRLGLEGQPRIVVFHEKEGRRHAHCVWSRIDTEEMKAIPLPHTKLKLRDLSKELYLENGWLMPRGFIDSRERDPANFTHAEWQQAKRTESDPRALKAMFAECWASSDSGKAFARALEERGYTLAKGDRRSVVALDFHGEVHAVARYAGIRTKEVRAKLGDGEGLPSVAEAKAQIAARMTPVVQRYIRESEAAFTSRAAPLQARKEAMAREHREERKRLDDAQEVRWIAETTARAARMPKGMRGLWARLTGKHERIHRQNELEAYQAYRRDQAQRQELIEVQLEERQRLQEDIRSARQDHTRDLEQLHRDVAHYTRLGAELKSAFQSSRERESPKERSQDQRDDLSPEP